MAGQALYVFEGDALLKQVSNRRDAERMRREDAGEIGVAQPVLHHVAHVRHVHPAIGEPSGFAAGGAEEGESLSARCGFRPRRGIRKSSAPVAIRIANHESRPVRHGGRHQVQIHAEAGECAGPRFRVTANRAEGMVPGGSITAADSR